MLSEGDVYITHAEPREHVAASADVAGGIAAVWAGLPRQEDQPWESNLIDLSTSELIRTVTGGAPALSNDGSRLAYRALEEVEVTEVDLKLPGETGALPQVGPVRIIDVGSGEVVHEFELRCEQYLMESEAVPSAGCTIARGGREWDLEFSSDGRLLAMADSYNDVMMVWDTATGERIIADDLPGSNARTIQFSPDGEQVVSHFSGGINYRMGVYNVGSIDGSVTGVQADSIRFPNGTSFAELVFTPDGSLAVAADNTGNLTLIDPDDVGPDRADRRPSTAPPSTLRSTLRVPSSPREVRMPTSGCGASPTTPFSPRSSSTSTRSPMSSSSTTLTSSLPRGSGPKRS